MSVKETPSPVVQLAQELFEEYYASCFWHWKRDLVITEAMVPAVIKGLRAHGNRQAFLAADQLDKRTR